MIRLAALMLLVLANAGRAGAVDVAAPVTEAENARIATIAKVQDAVVAVFGPKGEGGGSGVLISPDGYAVTNFHVSQACGIAMKCGLSDGKLYDAVLVGIDPTGDVALIRLFGQDRFPVAEVGNSDELKVGDWVLALGNPFLLAADFRPTVTYGLVSGIHRYQFPAGTLLEYTDCIQTDAAINPGNSGGPLFDIRGRLVGINGRASFEKRGRVNVGAAYAISINQVKNFLGGLRGGRIMDHATLGARVAFDSERRVVVTDILETSDAFRRGLRYGDEMVSFAGRPIETPNAFKNVLGIYPKGWRVPLAYRRDGKRVDVVVRLEALHSEEELLEEAVDDSKPRQKPAQKPKPEPKPGPKPGPKRPAPKGRIPDLKLPVRPWMPEVVKSHYENRRGFANYYFNRQERDRVLKAWRDGMGAIGDQTWTIGGKTGDGAQFSLEIADGAVMLKLPSRDWKWTDGESIEQAGPPNSGGLLFALACWRRLAVLPPEKFGEVSYLGPAPLVWGAKPVDVLSGVYGGAEGRLFIDSEAGRLLALELVVDENADPCEIRFSEFKTVDGRTLPQAIEIRRGEETFASLRCESFHAAGKEAKP